MNQMKARHMNIFFIVLILAFVIALSAQSKNIIISSRNYFKQKQRPDVSFPHQLHMDNDIECDVCHHDYKKDQTYSSDKGCAYCHGRKSGKDVYDPMQAFHLLCIGCHKNLIHNREKSGPVMCGKCHRKK